MIRNIIYLTHFNRKKVAEMCIALLPRVGYARVTRSGIVILKKSKWSLFRKRIPVTDIIIKYIPAEVGKLICNKTDQKVYVSLFNDKVATVVSLTKYCDKMDILDIVYKEYVKACFVVEPEEVNICLDYQKPIPQANQSFGMKTAFNRLNSGNTNKLSERIKKLRTRLPGFPLEISILKILSTR